MTLNLIVKNKFKLKIQIDCNSHVLPTVTKFTKMPLIYE